MTKELNDVPLQQLELPQGNIAYRYSDIGAEETFIFIHGWIDNMQSFSGLAPYFLDKFNCLFFDLPGHGFSHTATSREAYHFTSYISRLHDIILQLKIDKIRFIGHSFGAAIALCFASAFPEKIIDLSLIEGIAPIGEDENLAPQRLRDSVLAHSRKKKEHRHFETIEQAIALRQTASDLSFEEAQTLVKGQIKETAKGWQWTYDRRLKMPSPTRLSNTQICAYIAAVQAPVKLILGHWGYFLEDSEGEDIKPKPLTEEYLSHFKNIDVDVIDGHHHLHLTSPEIVAEIIFE